MTLAAETAFKVADVEALAGVVHSNQDLGRLFERVVPKSRHDRRALFNQNNGGNLDRA